VKNSAHTGCGMLTSFFILIYSYKKGSLLAAIELPEAEKQIQLIL
jgi:hypothetical protein